jgi:hypothetical protein
MFPIYSERQISHSRPESEQEYFMRMARNLRDQRSRERRQRFIARFTGRPHGKSSVGKSSLA